jgi:hypothetical protein
LLQDELNIKINQIDQVYEECCKVSSYYDDNNDDNDDSNDDDNTDNKNNSNDDNISFKDKVLFQSDYHDFLLKMSAITEKLLLEKNEEKKIEKITEKPLPEIKFNNPIFQNNLKNIFNDLKKIIFIENFKKKEILVIDDIINNNNDDNNYNDNNNNSHNY